MAVTLTISDLKQPDGELFAALFPGDDIDTLITGWLNKATILINASSIITTDHNNAALAYVYYSAYNYVALWLANAPASVSIDSGGVTKSTSNDQRKFFADKANYWLDFYNGYFPATTTTVSGLAFFGTVKARQKTWPC